MRGLSRSRPPPLRSLPTPQCRSSQVGIRNGTVRSEVYPSFESDAEIISIPPDESAYADCSIVVERDVEIHREKSKSE